MSYREEKQYIRECIRYHFVLTKTTNIPSLYRALCDEWPNPLYPYTETYPMISESNMISYLKKVYNYIDYMSIEDNLMFYIKYILSEIIKNKK